MKLISEPWTQAEKEILRESYLTAEKDKIKLLLPNRTWRAIRAKASSLGLWLKGKKEPMWAEDELNILKKYKGRLTIKELQGFLPSRSLQAIFSKSENLGISSKYFWIDEEIEALKKYFPTRDKQKLKHLLPDRSWCSIKQKAHKLGVQGVSNATIQRERLKLLNKDPEFNRKRVKALCQKPTKPENLLLEIIEEYKLPYRYVGDGSFIIEGLNPDFVNINGKKHIIEVFGRIWHDNLVKQWHRTELGRMMIFSSYGYKTLVIWDDEMEDKEAVVSKINQFGKPK